MEGNWRDCGCSSDPGGCDRERAGVYVGKQNHEDQVSEDIGDLATQSAYCTEVHATKSSRELFGITILFTQSKIYSYDVIIKAGLDFAQIQWEEKGYVLEVRLPEIRILSSEIEMDSFKPYHEDEAFSTRSPWKKITPPWQG